MKVAVFLRIRKSLFVGAPVSLVEFFVLVL
jgi:hypothetical protein